MAEGRTANGGKRSAAATNKRQCALLVAVIGGNTDLCPIASGMNEVCHAAGHDGFCEVTLAATEKKPRESRMIF